MDVVSNSAEGTVLVSGRRGADLVKNVSALAMEATAAAEVAWHWTPAERIVVHVVTEETIRAIIMDINSDRRAAARRACSGESQIASGSGANVAPGISELVASDAGSAVAPAGVEVYVSDNQWTVAKLCYVLWHELAHKWQLEQYEMYTQPPYVCLPPGLFEAQASSLVLEVLQGQEWSSVLADSLLAEDGYASITQLYREVCRANGLSVFEGVEWFKDRPRMSAAFDSIAKGTHASSTFVSELTDGGVAGIECHVSDAETIIVENNGQRDFAGYCEGRWRIGGVPGLHGSFGTPPFTLLLRAGETVTIRARVMGMALNSGARVFPAYYRNLFVVAAEDAVPSVINDLRP
jgi:hypothetical protein